MVIDPRREAVLIADQGTGQFVDRTRDVVRYETQTVGGKIDIVFKSDPKVFSFRSERVLILRNAVRVPLPQGVGVEVCGAIWENTTEVWNFIGPGGALSRVFYIRGKGEEVYRSYPTSQVRIIPSVAQSPRVADVLSYWHDIEHYSKPQLIEKKNNPRVAL